jgi:hypothetical protein
LDTNIKKEQIVSQSTKPSAPINKQATNDQTEQIKILLSESIYELKELHVDIDTSNIEIMNAISANQDYQHELHILISNFQRYASILLLYHFFTNLSQSITTLTNVLKDDRPKDTEAVRKAFVIMESFLFVLGKWQVSLQELNITDINYFDASIINDIQTIINIWKGSASEDEDSIEFF